VGTGGDGQCSSTAGLNETRGQRARIEAQRRVLERRRAERVGA
jgi:hypothetical protein